MLAVTFPMKAATLCTPKRAVRVTAITFAIEATIHLQAFFLYKLPDVPNATLIASYPDARCRETLFHVYNLILGTIAPFSILVISNTIITISIRRAATRRKQMAVVASEKTGKEPNLTAMLMMTTFFYFLLSSPKRIYDTVYPQYDLADPYWLARHSLQFIVWDKAWVANFAINFYVYFLGGGRKFRQDVKDIFVRGCWCWVRR